MAQRRRRRRRRAGWKRVVLIVVCAILAVSLGLGLRMVRSYMRQTHVGFFTAVRDTVRIGFRQLGNLTPGADSPVATSPYSSTDFYEEDGFIRCSSSEVSRVGIDVSSHQGQIDWAQVRDAGVEFAIIRVGFRGYGETGKLVEDEYARANLEGALAAGLKVGAYFFSQATNTWEALEEVRLTLSVIRDFPIEMPVVFDWEYLGEYARTATTDQETVTACTAAFCNAISLAGYQPMFYSNQNLGETHFDLAALSDYPMWLAMYNTEMDYPHRLYMWQYTSDGSVPGIDGPVDLNLYLPE